MEENVLQIKGLVKDFPGVRAVNEVSFDIKRNVVHCLVGENGAGKSTLIKILTGAYERTCGDSIERGALLRQKHPKEARDKGISTLFQELNVVNQLTVEENLTLGTRRYDVRFPEEDGQNQQNRHLINSLEPSISPGTGLHAERGEEADRRNRQSGRVENEHHHHGRADGRHVRI